MNPTEQLTHDLLILAGDFDGAAAIAKAAKDAERRVAAARRRTAAKARRDADRLAQLDSHLTNSGL
jgi:hypothetical protein